MNVDSGKSSYFEIKGTGKVMSEWFEAEKNSSGTYELTAKGKRDMETAMRDADNSGGSSGGSSGGC